MRASKQDTHEIETRIRGCILAETRRCVVRRLEAIATALLLLAGTLLAADFWEKAEYTSWSQKDC